MKCIKTGENEVEINYKVDWNGLWNKSLQNLPKKNNPESWDNIASKFNEWMEKDDYPEKLLNRIELDSNDSVLDIGCGNGVITIPLAQKAIKVTAMDISSKMLEILMKNAKDSGLNNINTFNQRIEDVTEEDVGKHDVVVASRSLNGVSDIGKELEKINNIAKKSVYLTLWGADNRRFEREMAQLLGRESHRHPDYIYVYNILHDLGIYANVEMLESNTRNYYSNVEEALDRLRWRIGDLNKDEESILREYLEENMIKTTDGTITYSNGKADWVLIWWKKSE
ncbi:class I SAM-dependent methyltransferase [Methanobacterium formicicum]|uniref:Type 11 methyltransferase n=1 Tax=Methanobacterium formicicum TaxID=2162 RepID=A0A090I3L6_METFO|nr:class I SAM-dependent methyltransferase [Methanobacterium formicicum]MDG3546866.1 class I SAM-dependent methyltransferase [Methanobacterium formicicum]MDH2660541.1 class I SAM-dependent methyltransferase [Methanobacterium formicicum]CEA13858.1 type 11 methyltransferase [Methanobacterium formicicum]